MYVCVQMTKQQLEHERNLKKEAFHQVDDLLTQVCTVAAPDGRQNCCSIVCECSLEYLMKACFLEIAMLLVFVYHHVWFHLL